MGGQDGPSRELSGWLRMLAGWLSDSQVYCKDAASIQSQTINLTPLSSNKSGQKLAVIRVSSTKAIMIESRREKQNSRVKPNQVETAFLYTYDANQYGQDFLVPITEPGRDKR